MYHIRKGSGTSCTRVVCMWLVYRQAPCLSLKESSLQLRATGFWRMAVCIVQQEIVFWEKRGSKESGSVAISRRLAVHWVPFQRQCVVD